MKRENNLSFSIVIETENLAKTELSRFHRCMESLADQRLPITLANEVLLVDSDDVTPETIDKLCTRYPWLTHHKSQSNANYYQVKMEGAASVTGDIVVFCDSDCIYDSNWLDQMLQPFNSNERIQIVSGETAMTITGSYSLAIALIWGFPTFSRRLDIYEVRHYAANNVAFRRDFLSQHPIPSDVTYYRGNCAMHAVQFRELGHKIWKQDRAITIHPLPAIGFSEFFWRLLVMGPDWLQWNRVSSESERGQRWMARSYQDLLRFARVVLRWLLRPVLKLPRALREDPRRIIFLPLAIPIILSGIIIFISGYFLGHVCPDVIRTLGVNRLERLEQLSEEPRVG